MNYEQKRFIGERALFKGQDLELTYCTFADGESPLKESRNIAVNNSLFEWKYPFWYCKNIRVADSIFHEMARAGIWYTNDVSLERVTYEAPKGFRRCDGVTLKQVAMPNAAETLWNCKNVTLEQVDAKGDYFAMGSENMEIVDFSLTGNYPFDGCKNVVIRNGKLLSKDAFWNCENVTVYNSFISGEYLGWNSKNVTFVDCVISSEQGMCYMEGLTMKNCRLINTNLAFEYVSGLDAQIEGEIDSIKNPISGKISAGRIKEIIFDDPHIDPGQTIIMTE